MRWLKLWFRLDGQVEQRVYLGSGLFLMALKYGVDQVISKLSGGNFLDPLTYLHPFLSVRVEALGLDASSWAVMAMAIWALPFIWIGVSMSMRRASHAGLPPLIALLFLLPMLNMLLILALCASPPGDDTSPPDPKDVEGGSMMVAAIKAVALTSLLGLAATVLAVFGLGDYSSTLFVATPFVMGVLGTWVLSQQGRVTLGRAILVSVMGVTICGGALVLFSLEGVLCLVMASPIAYTLGAMGAAVGIVIVRGAAIPDPSVTAMMIGLPLMGVLESRVPTELPLRAVTTDIVIEAAPEDIWPNVIGFSELPPPQDWMMKTGVACPMRARIEGEGVGAVRHCEFTTGAFVEPITTWEPPHLLAFDVVEQPPSMEEWSPWRVVHAPHIVGTMQSQRGQFELIEIAPNRTRLVGTTWYTLDLAPGAYWSLFSNAVVHRIHGRVLRHIKGLSEG